MEKQLFRKKSIDRISSPEELNNYLRVTNPSVWIGLLAIILLLAGLIVWASVDTLETKTDALVEAKNGELMVIVTGVDALKVQEGMIVRIDNEDSSIDAVEFDEYGRAIGKAILNIPDGKYKAEVVLETIKPISFLFR